jgi:hypothetical protein
MTRTPQEIFAAHIGATLAGDIHGQIDASQGLDLPKTI